MENIPVNNVDAQVPPSHFLRSRSPIRQRVIDALWRAGPRGMTIHECGRIAYPTDDPAVREQKQRKMVLNIRAVDSIRIEFDQTEQRVMLGVARTPAPNIIPPAPSPSDRASTITSVRAGISTPPIPNEFRNFRAQPHYTSIFEIYPSESHIYGTEDWHGDWAAEVLFVAKDAGSSRIFLPPSKGGRGWAWVTNHSRPTNRNLRPLLDMLPGGKLYGSFLGPLLRNDERESGNLVMDDAIRGFVKSLFLWTVANMACSKITVAVLGEDAWREIMLAIGLPAERSMWKSRRLSGQPLATTVAGKEVSFVALYHPARIPPDRLALQPGWQWILRTHGHH